MKEKDKLFKNWCKESFLFFLNAMKIFISSFFVFCFGYSILLAIYFLSNLPLTKHKIMIFVLLKRDLDAI